MTPRPGSHAAHAALPKEPEWNNKSTQVDIIAGRGLDNALNRITYFIPATKRWVTALQTHRIHQDAARQDAGQRWREHNLVFASAVGTELDSHNVRRAFRKIVHAADLVPGRVDTTRDAAVSPLPTLGLRHGARRHPQLIGHSGTAVTHSWMPDTLDDLVSESSSPRDTPDDPVSESSSHRGCSMCASDHNTPSRHPTRRPHNVCTHPQ